MVKPELAIALEGGITGDVYPGRPEETQAKLGAGLGMFLYDSSALPNRKLTAFVKQVALIVNYRSSSTWCRVMGMIRLRPRRVMAGCRP
jgi:putative aminopeptidase FrvX